MGNGRNQEAKRGKEKNVKAKRMEERERRHESGSSVCGDNLGSPVLREAHASRSRCNPADVSVPSTFSSEVTQVTGVPLGQLLRRSPEEALYYLPCSSPVKGLGLHWTELHCVYMQKNSVFNISDMTVNIVSWSAICRTTFSEDQGHYSWFLKMSLTLNPCKQILALTFRGVFSRENLPDVLVFTSTPLGSLCFGRILSGPYSSTLQPSSPRETPARVSSDARGTWLPFTEKKLGY